MPSARLQFSEKYDDEHAKRYHRKHNAGLQRRLSNWMEHRIAAQALALAGAPARLLDIPCGAGRFWSLLSTLPNCDLYASDNSQDMLNLAAAVQDQRIVERFNRFQSSAFDINMSNGSVDLIFCMRLLHHLGSQQDRKALLDEFHRVTSNSIIISLWVDGNHKSYRRGLLERQERNKAYQNRFVIRREQIEKEFTASGFDVAATFDLLKFVSMWRVYLLRKA